MFVCFLFAMAAHFLLRLPTRFCEVAAARWQQRGGSSEAALCVLASSDGSLQVGRPLTACWAMIGSAGLLCLHCAVLCCDVLPSRDSCCGMLVMGCWWQGLGGGTVLNEEP